MQLKSINAEDSVADEGSSDEFSVEWADMEAGGRRGAEAPDSGDQDENGLVGNTKQFLSDDECPVVDDGGTVETTPAPIASIVSVPDTMEGGNMGTALMKVAPAAVVSAARRFEEDEHQTGDELTQPLLESPPPAA